MDERESDSATTHAMAAADGAYHAVTSASGAGGAVATASPSPATTITVATAASETSKKRKTALPPPVDDDEAERRKLFYAELRRHRRAFGIVGPRVNTHEPEHEDDTGSHSTDRQQQRQQQQQQQQQSDESDSSEHTHASELYMETMSNDFGPVEKDDPAFMRNFPKVFASWETFDNALERFTRGTFQLMRTHTTQATVSRNKSTLKYLSTQVIPGTFIGHFYPECFEWYKKVLVCAICRAASARIKKLGRGAGVGAFKDTDAKVTAHLQPEADNSKRFVIDVSWSGAHNHRCDDDELAKFTHGAGRLDDPVLLSLVRKMRQEGKEPRDVKRFIYECTGKRCSTKDVHAIYQRMGTDGDGDDDVVADEAALDFLTDDQSHTVATVAHARTGATVAAASNTLSIEFDTVSGRLQSASVPERNLAMVQQSISRLASTLASHEQADLAHALQSTLSAWTLKRRKPNASVAAAAVAAAAAAMNSSSTPAFQYPSPHMSNAFDYRRYDDVGADLLMGLDTPGTASVFGGGGTAVNSNGGSGMGNAGASRAAVPQKRRRPS